MTAGLGFSLAANTLFTWPGGPVRVVGGLFASLALPAAVHLYPAIPAHTVSRRVLRAAVMSAIAAMAAATTFVHASRLLIAHGEDPWLAAAYPLCTELLVVMAVLAHRAPDRPAVRHTRGKATTVPREPRPGPATPPTAPAGAPTSKRAAAQAHARAHPGASGREIALAVGASRAEGNRARRVVLDEREAVS